MAPITTRIDISRAPWNRARLLDIHAIEQLKP
jgi:hypothetical protein